jgi:SAM-dependent methyltransferase
VVEQRRGALRTAVVWDTVSALLAGRSGLQVVDLGGGTGGLAVRVAALGHRVTVVDPSPDALAALQRRADDDGVAARVRGVQGDAADLLDHVEPGGADLVLCHGVLEVVDEPDQALASIHQALHPGGSLSVVVAGRLASVVARALAGHFDQATELLDDGPAAGTEPGGARDGRRREPRRYTREEILDLLEQHGLHAEQIHAVRVFTDLVPSALVDAEPGAASALLALERAVAERPEFVALAAQLHAVARRN